MKIDFNTLLRGEQSELSFTGTLDLAGITPDVISGKADFTGKAFDRSGFVELKLIVSLKERVTCSRCTKEFDRTEDFGESFSLFESEEDAKNAGYEDAEDYYVLDGGVLDVAELVRATVILNMPMRFVCKPSCKGICPKCGKDLNKGECDCDMSEPDPRLAKLREYLAKLENNTDEEG